MTDSRVPATPKERRLDFASDGTMSYRDVDPMAAEAELRLRLRDLDARLDRLADAQSVTHDLLQLEFSV